ncbi:MAG: class I SAM-dependent methyltransferase [Acidimicrobiales bacterium]
MAAISSRQAKAAVVPARGSGAPSSEMQRVRRIYERLAPRYDRVMDVVDRLVFPGGRDWVCRRATGETLEVAVGTGRNLGRYPPGARLTAVDASPAMLAAARRRAATLASSVDLREGDAEHLAFPDAAFDSVVVTLALCTIPDDGAAVAEMARVLRPGGRLLVLEHTASPRPLVRAAQGLADPLAARLGGDHLLRRPDALVKAAGLVVDEVERTALGITLRLAAHKPASRDTPTSLR